MAREVRHLPARVTLCFAAGALAAACSSPVFDHGVLRDEQIVHEITASHTSAQEAVLEEAKEAGLVFMQDYSAARRSAEDPSNIDGILSFMQAENNSYVSNPEANRARISRVLNARNEFEESSMRSRNELRPLKEQIINNQSNKPNRQMVVGLSFGLLAFMAPSLLPTRSTDEHNSSKTMDVV